MAKKKKSKNKKKQLKLNTDMKVILLILLGIILAILIYGNSGYVGNFLNEILGGMVGIFKYLVPIVPFISAIYMVSNNKEDLLSKIIPTSIIMLCCLATMTLYQILNNALEYNIQFSEIIDRAFYLGKWNKGGGIIGILIAYPLVKLFEPIAALIIILGIAVIVAVFVFGLKPSEHISNIVNKVKFSTDFNADGLTDIGDCKNFEVLSTDSKYKSIDGCIYTKDGKTLVAIPYGKSEVKIAEGCEEVRVSSYSYASYRYVNSKAVYRGYNGCGQLRKITFPSTFKTLSTDDNISVYAGKRQQKYTDIQIELNTNYIDEDCVKLFWNSNQLWRKSLAAELERIGCVTIKDNMVILEDGGLCGYIGESENVEITIPNNVKYICENAFNSLSDATVQNFSIKSIVLNDNIEEIPVGAFCGNKNIKV